MRRWIAVPVAGLAALALATGGAGADSAAPGGPGPGQPSITVNGSATAPLPANASDADQQAAYQSALGDALTAAQAKAAFVASREGLSLGAVWNVTENSDSSGQGCGVEPLEAAATAPAARPPSKKKKTTKKKAKAHKSQVIEPASGCPVQASVTVTYLASPSSGGSTGASGPTGSTGTTGSTGPTAG